jgi:hypothetical protein
VAVGGLRARWSLAEGASQWVALEGLGVGKAEGGGWRVAAEGIEAVLPGARGTAKGVELQLGEGEGPRRLSVVAADEASVDLVGPVAGLSEPLVVPATTPVGAEGKGRTVVATALARLRSQVGALGFALEGATREDARVEVQALSARIRVNDEVISVGPGRFAVRREAGSPRHLVLEVAPASTEGSAKSLRAPYGEGAATAPVRLEIQGGPVPVAALGLRGGDLGLVEPERAWLEADATISVDEVARSVRFEGAGKVRGLSLRHPAVSDDAIRGLDVGFRGTVAASLDGGSVQVDSGELEVGALRLTATGNVRRTAAAESRPADWAVDVRWEVPLVACQSLLDAAPAGLLPLVSGSTMAGSLAVKGSIAFDTAQLDKTYDARWDAAVGCRMVAPRPQVAVERFTNPFKKTIYSPEGSTQEAEFGPGTPGWTPGARITHVMGIAVVTAEDGRFARHGGFDHEAIRNSIRENLRARKFVRGASTISMQLAKNLYLPRDKTLSRKLEEAVLTLYLEQVLTKEQIIELYLNVVEFGPMIYGIGPAAQHYFRTSPGALTVSQCFYLASILPSPKQQHFAAGGAVTGTWNNHLRRLMKYANKRGRLSDSELDEGLREVPVFGSSAPIREAPPPLPEDGGEDVLRREPWGEGDG